LQKTPALQVRVTSLGHGRYKLKVTVSIAGVGPDEATVDTQPVYHATLQLGRARSYTNSAGVAIVRMRKSHRVTITAGDTLKPVSANL
jgi:hypothetical protein